MLLVGLAACAGTSETSPPDESSGGAGATGGEGGAGAGVSAGGAGGAVGLIPQACPVDTYAVDIDDDGMLGCAPLDVDVASAVENNCSFYFGWRDGCSGCTSGPAKAGRVDGSSCENLAGADNTCSEATLGAVTLPVFGLNTDGDVDGNDMFYLGWYCREAGETGLAGPCEAGEHAVRVTTDGFVECVPSERIVADYVRESCSVYFGWRDGCNGCANPPSKWGVQGGLSCEIGAGADNFCGAPFVGEQWVPQIGINTDGDVDDNDTFFVGVSCDAGVADEVVATDRCPFGTLLVGIDEGGGFRCASPSPAIAPVVQDDCAIYFGYRDGCGACASPPVKWGRATTASCDAAAGSTCGAHDLGGTTVNLLGIRTDGDVDGNDKLYVGLSCQ